MDPNLTRTEAAVAGIAATQHGLVTREQALEAGMHRRAIERRLADGSWLRVRRGVYRSAFAPPTWHQRALAACIDAPCHVAVSHQSAAYLHGLVERPAPRIHVVVPHSDRAKERRRAVAVHRTRELSPRDIVVIEGVPATSLERTLIDLAATMPRSGLAELVDRAVRGCPGERARDLLLSRLREATRSRRRGSPALRQALAAWQPETERPRELQSVLEAGVMRLLVGAGLPLPESQHRVELPVLGSVYLDFAWPPQRIALEVDGYAFHSSRPAFEHDRRRGNLLLAEGWNVLHTTASEVRDQPAGLVNAIAAALGVDAGVADHRRRGRGHPRPGGRDRDDPRGCR